MGYTPTPIEARPHIGLSEAKAEIFPNFAQSISVDPIKISDMRFYAATHLMAHMLGSTATFRINDDKTPITNTKDFARLACEGADDLLKAGGYIQ